LPAGEPFRKDGQTLRLARDMGLDIAYLAKGLSHIEDFIWLLENHFLRSHSILQPQDVFEG